jgi:hypothetical protein
MKTRQFNKAELLVVFTELKLEYWKCLVIVMPLNVSTSTLHRPIS